MTDEINRRDFMKRAAYTTAGVSLSMAGFSTTKVLGANDRIRLGVIGTGRQGTDDMKNFMKHGVEVAAVCDVYQPNLDKGLAAAGGNAKAVKDFRSVLDDKDIDVVLVATPDHWHPLPMVEACKAGKDVYVEKPICVAVEEGQKMVAAARANKTRRAGRTLAALQPPLPESRGVGAERRAGQGQLCAHLELRQHLPRWPRDLP